jgi:F0F1-type ATP synthase membrane subunit b/b'
VIERDRVLDMIDDVKAELPVELKRARDLLADKESYIASAKRDVETMRKKAEDYANHLVDKDVVVREAQERADEIIAEAEDMCRTLKNAASEYCEDTLRRMEEAVADAYDEVKQSRANFRNALGIATPSSQPSNRRAVYDAEAED